MPVNFVINRCCSVLEAFLNFVCRVLTWHPAGEVHVTSMRETILSIRRGGQITSGH